MFPSLYNNAYQILQTPGYVVIFHEMIHDARIIPIDQRQHIDQRIRHWMGDAQGRWDGDTLVVETTNFHDKGRIRGRPHSEALRIIERFTRTNDDTLQWEATIEDPKVWVASWKAAISLKRDDRYQMFEYACHEGNYAIGNILRGARAQEKAAVGSLKH